MDFMDFDLVIRDGNVVTATEQVFCDIGIKRGMIAAIGDKLPKGEREIDADGNYVFPGGIDSHTHIEQLSSSGIMWHIKTRVMAEPRPTGKISDLLRKWSDGDDDVLDELTPLVYAELRRMARGFLRFERPGHTLQPTALTHEAFLRLVDQQRVNWESRTHFFAIAARLMRRILVDHARARQAKKRAPTKVPVGDGTPLDVVDVLALHCALERLEAKDPEQGRLVELRYFGGLTIEETSRVMKVSPATVKREWSLAKRWLRRELRKA